MGTESLKNFHPLLVCQVIEDFSALFAPTFVFSDKRVDECNEPAAGGAASTAEMGSKFHCPSPEEEEETGSLIPGMGNRLTHSVPRLLTLASLPACYWSQVIFEFSARSAGGNGSRSLTIPEWLTWTAQ